MKRRRRTLRPKFLGIFPLLKHYDTKAAETKDASEKGKTFIDHHVVETREFRGRGTAQGALNAEHGKNTAMTIDQVRELLNKNK